MPDAAARIADVHQRASIGSMFASELTTICLNWGWSAIAVGGALAMVQARRVAASNRA